MSPVNEKRPRASLAARRPVVNLRRSNPNRVLCDPLEYAATFDEFDYAQALAETESFFWRDFTDTYLELVKVRARDQGGYISPRDYRAANAASRSMRLTGVVILLFLLFHLADLTWGTVNPDFVRGDVYRNLVASLDRPVVALIYIVANIALGIHLFHGAWSLFQSLGVNNPRWNSARRVFATSFAAIVMVGNVSIPMAVQLGIVSADDEPACQVSGGTIETCELYQEGA